MNKFKFGDKVWHEKYGLGVITSNRQQDDDYAYIDVTFIEYKGSEFKEYVPVEYLTPASDWVKCSERMPKHGEMVLVFNGNSIEIDALAIGEFDFECWCDSVTHWMPLPTPPMEIAND